MRSVPVEIGGTEYKLRFDFNALADMEGRSNKGIAHIFSDENIGFNTIRLLYWAGLKWKIKGLTVERTGQLLGQAINEGRSFESLLDPVVEALKLSGILPKGDEPQEESEEPAPN